MHSVSYPVTGENTFTMLTAEYFAIINMNDLCNKSERSSAPDPNFWVTVLDTVVNNYQLE